VASFKKLSRNLPGGTEKNKKSLSHDIRFPGLDFNPGPSEYEQGLTIDKIISNFLSVSSHAISKHVSDKRVTDSSDTYRSFKIRQWHFLNHTCNGRISMTRSLSFV
jgi:hypothetical protein